MWARLSIVAGLVLGIAAAGLLLGGLFAFAPETPLPSVAIPSAPVASAAPSVAPSPLASASTEPSVAPSQAVLDGQPAPPLVVPGVGRRGIHPCPSCRDQLPLMKGFAARYADEWLAPDVKLEDLKAAVPRVAVTP